MDHSEKLNELAKALAKCQGEILPAIKNKENPAFRSTYVDFFGVWEVAQKPLADNGLSITHSMINVDGRLYNRAMLLHTSGQYLTALVPLLLGKREDMQAIGSCSTYSRRYATCMLLGIVAEVEAKVRDYYSDDDGESACGRGVIPENSTFTVNIPPKNVQTNVTPGNGGRITLDQIKELTLAIDQCLDSAYANGEVCRVAGIPDISKIPSSEFPKALAWVKTLVKKAVK